MFWSRNLINKVQERALGITYKDQLTHLKSLLSNDNETTIHQRNLHVLMTEIYKIMNHIAPPIMSSLFEIRENTHNTRHFQVLSNESRAPFLWANRTLEYKLANSLTIFKRKIKNWKGENCPCRLCKTYVRELGYIQFSSDTVSIYNMLFFLFNTIKNKKSLNAQPFTAKKIF